MDEKLIGLRGGPSTRTWVSAPARVEPRALVMALRMVGQLEWMNHKDLAGHTPAGPPQAQPPPATRTMFDGAQSVMSTI